MSSDKSYLRLLFFIGAFVPVLALLGVACGGSGGTTDNPGPGGVEATASEGTTDDPGSGGGDSSAFEVFLGDNFFEPNQFAARAGVPVTFSITNNGMAIHNMRIDGPDGQYNTGDDAVSEPQMIKGGETATLTWTPPEPGTYRFRCDYHPTSGGTITVS